MLNLESIRGEYFSNKFVCFDDSMKYWIELHLKLQDVLNNTLMLTTFGEIEENKSWEWVIFRPVFHHLENVACKR